MSPFRAAGPHRSMARTMLAGAAAASAVLLMAACGSAGDNHPTAVLAAISAREQAAAAAAAPAAGSAAATSAAAAVACTSPAKASYPALASLPQPTAMPENSLERQIASRGHLVVGVSGDTRLLGARDLLAKGQPLEGFDIEIAKAIGRAIFGVDGKVQFKVITAGQRFQQVNDGAAKDGVDLVARAVSMTCDRWQNKDLSKSSAFSVAYLESDQRLLVGNGVATSIDGLVKAKAKICAPIGSTSLTNVQKVAGITAVPVAIHSDCLALWQEGKVDAITGDDVILAGFQAQDPSAVILGGKALDTTPYGLAIAKSHPEFVAFVNAVMAGPQFRASWAKAYASWLAAPLENAPKTFPAPDTTRPVPAATG